MFNKCYYGGHIKRIGETDYEASLWEWDICKKIETIQGKKPLKRSRNRWQENISIHKNENQYEYMYWIKLAWTYVGQVLWRSLLNISLKLYYITLYYIIHKMWRISCELSALSNNTRHEDSFVLTPFAYFNQLVSFIIFTYLVPTS